MKMKRLFIFVSVKVKSKAVKVYTVLCKQQLLSVVCPVQIIKTVATRYHILRPKCTKFDFRWGCWPRPCWGSSQLDLRGPTSKEGMGWEGRSGEERWRDERGGEGSVPGSFSKILALGYRQKYLCLYSHKATDTLGIYAGYIRAYTVHTLILLHKTVNTLNSKKSWHCLVSCKKVAITANTTQKHSAIRYIKEQVNEIRQSGNKIFGWWSPVLRPPLYTNKMIFHCFYSFLSANIVTGSLR